ncbi:MAG: competence/damage-inducible protein A [Epulopiscium sp. Nuni2H_MBin003]|nr:MAG: competence/damage-inducible protein A [Epulopiscium sp. Nuni2H_MBin003]
MKIEVIAVGNEVVYGYTVNTNASFMARELEKYGAEVCYHTSIRDRKEDIFNALDVAKNRVDTIILCGGLGPTKDDLTKEMVCEYYNLEMEKNKEALDELKDFFRRMQKEMLETNFKQIYLPIGSHLLINRNGTAPGCVFEADGNMVALFPGPPRELKPMFNDFIEQHIVPQLDKRCITEEVRLLGIGESQIASEIDDLLGVFEEVEVAPYLGEGYVSIRIKGYGTDKDTIEKNIDYYKNQISTRLKQYVIGDTKKVIEEVVYEYLLEKSLTISTAESCTGGLLASRLINNNGASNIFNEGFITYSNQSKINILGVKKETLDSFGAVSYEVANEMALGVMKKTGADIGISITGIAGPTGETAEKPVGLIYIGIATKHKCVSIKVNLYGTRNEIRKLATAYALQNLLKILQNTQEEL